MQSSTLQIWQRPVRVKSAERCVAQKWINFRSTWLNLLYVSMPAVVAGIEYDDAKGHGHRRWCRLGKTWKISRSYRCRTLKDIWKIKVCTEIEQATAILDEICAADQPPACYFLQHPAGISGFFARLSQDLCICMRKCGLFVSSSGWRPTDWYLRMTEIGLDGWRSLVQEDSSVIFQVCVWLFYALLWRESNVCVDCCYVYSLGNFGFSRVDWCFLFSTSLRGSVRWLTSCFSRGLNTWLNQPSRALLHLILMVLGTFS